MLRNKRIGARRSIRKQSYRGKIIVIIVEVSDYFEAEEELHRATNSKKQFKWIIMHVAWVKQVVFVVRLTFEQSGRKISLASSRQVASSCELLAQWTFERRTKLCFAPTIGIKCSCNIFVLPLHRIAKTSCIRSLQLTVRTMIDHALCMMAHNKCTATTHIHNKILIH